MAFCGESDIKEIHRNLSFFTVPILWLLLQWAVNTSMTLIMINNWFRVFEGGLFELLLMLSKIIWEAIFENNFLKLIYNIL